MRQLLIGAGNSHDKRVWFPESPDKEFGDDVTTLDLNADADITHDLDDLPYPIEDSKFHEIHAYEILEHCGSQGDGDFFFEQFNEFHRILKPGGFMVITVPKWDSEAAFGVPDHKRVLPISIFGHLVEEHYENVGKPGYADYRHLINGYWKVAYTQEMGDAAAIVLQRQNHYTEDVL